MSETRQEPRPAIVWTLRADGTADCEEHGPFQHYRGGPKGCPTCKVQQPHAEETD
jgi:hypothetical protein